MDRITVKILLVLLLICLPANAGIIMRGSGGCNAPAWYNQTGITVTSGTGNVVFAWDAANASAPNAPAYSNTCTEITGTIQAGDITTFDSKTVFKADASGDYILFTQTSNQYANFGADQTVCIDIWFADPPNEATIFLRIEEDSPGTDLYQMTALTNLVLRGTWVRDGVTQDGLAAMTEDAWDQVAYSYEYAGSGTDHSTNAGGGWSDGSGEIANPMVDGATDILLGSFEDNPGGAGNEIYIRRMAIINGYKADCSELTGW